jgi:hypothetical protein
MLGRKNFTPDELQAAHADVDGQLTAWRGLADVVPSSGDGAARAALEALEPAYFNAALLALDRRFVHRVRMVAGKKGTPVNEVELISDSIRDNDNLFRGNTVISYDPASAVLQLKPGDRIALTADQFAELARAFLDEIGTKFC